MLRNINKNKKRRIENFGSPFFRSHGKSFLRDSRVATLLLNDTRGEKKTNRARRAGA